MFRWAGIFLGSAKARIDTNYVRSRPDLMQMWRDVAPGNVR
jgi:hypothetical protein